MPNSSHSVMGKQCEFLKKAADNILFRASKYSQHYYFTRAYFIIWVYGLD